MSSNLTCECQVVKKNIEKMPSESYHAPMSSAQRTIPRVVAVTCAVVEDELRELARGMDHVAHIAVLPQGLHNTPDELRTQLQCMITQMEEQYGPDAIVLGYGLCSRGTEGVTTRKARLVMARAHDCITLLLGSKERYAQYVRDHPGTYWYSPGWNKHHMPPGKERYEKLRAQYVEKYGQDNADFLMEAEQTWFSNYDRATFVDIGIAVSDQDLAHTRACAKWLGWTYDHQQGDPSLMRDLLTGPWDEQRFIVLEPGESMELSPDEKVVRKVEIRRKAAE
jgi:hypothetical protein